MIPKIIKNETDYEAALARIDELMDVIPGTSEEDELRSTLTSDLRTSYNRGDVP